MKKIAEILSEKDFIYSVEFVPPRNGGNYEQPFKFAEKLKPFVDFVSVTMSAGGSLRGGSLPVSYFIYKRFNIPVLTHFTTMAYDISSVENTLADCTYFGLKNILVLGGDVPIGSSDKKQYLDTHHKYAYQLVEQIGNMNKGKYLTRESDDTEFRKANPTDFSISVAAHPEYPNLDDEIKFLKSKFDAGAEFAITQMFFTVEEYIRYVEKARAAGITMPIIPGLRPLTKYSQCDTTEKTFNVKVPDDIRKLLKEAKDESDARGKGLNYIVELAKKLREAGAPGIHLFMLFDVDAAVKIIGDIKTK